MSREDAQAYLDEMVARRGYVLDYHKRLVTADLPVARAANELIEAAYLKQRRLDRGIKELVFIATLAALRAPKAHVQSHIRVALAEGVQAEEILEALEIVLPEAGVVAFQEGFEAWAEVVGVQPLEPRTT